MTHHHDSPSTPSVGFSAAQYRHAMGPGYQVATFREQPVVLGQTIAPTTIPAAQTMPTRAPLRRRVGMRPARRPRLLWFGLALRQTTKPQLAC